jgi:hypothetical protein
MPKRQEHGGDSVLQGSLFPCSPHMATRGQQKMPTRLVLPALPSRSGLQQCLSLSPYSMKHSSLSYRPASVK